MRGFLWEFDFNDNISGGRVGREICKLLAPLSSGVHFLHLLPRARAFPDVAHGALERLGVVSEGADGAVPEGGARSIDGIG